MNTKDTPKEEFKEIIYESCKALGLDDFPSRIISTLQSEVEEISLGDIAKITGYSLSALSTTIKAMEERNLVKRFKKPGSRKVYVIMDKNITSFFIELQKKRYEQSIKPSLSLIPDIIERYKDSEEFQDQLKIVKDYYHQILFLAEENRKFIQTLETGVKRV